MAAAVRLSDRGYQKYELGLSSPTPEILDRFSKVLGCRPWDLLLPPNAKVIEDTDSPASFHLSENEIEDAVMARAFRLMSKIRRYGLLFLATANREWLTELDRAIDSAPEGSLDEQLAPFRVIATVLKA